MTTKTRPPVTVEPRLELVTPVARTTRYTSTSTKTPLSSPSESPVYDKGGLPIDGATEPVIQPADMRRTTTRPALYTETGEAIDEEEVEEEELGPMGTEEDFEDYCLECLGTGGACEPGCEIYADAAQQASSGDFPWKPVLIGGAVVAALALALTAAK